MRNHGGVMNPTVDNGTSKRMNIFGGQAFIVGDVSGGTGRTNLLAIASGSRHGFALEVDSLIDLGRGIGTSCGVCAARSWNPSSPLDEREADRFGGQSVYAMLGRCRGRPHTAIRHADHISCGPCDACSQRPIRARITSHHRHGEKADDIAMHGPA